MLIEFRVKNFKSFRDEQVFSMVASSDRTLPENTIASKLLGGRKVVRSAVLYGANASGKSNLVAALGFVQDFVAGSAERKRSTEIPVQPFRLDPGCQESPSEFEINFIHQEVRYQYSFSVDRQRVCEERLVAYPKGLPQTWFERTLKPDSEESEWYFGPQLKGEKRRLVSVTRPDVLFLSVAATFNHEQLSNVYEWFSIYLHVIDVSKFGNSFGGHPGVIFHFYPPGEKRRTISEQFFMKRTAEWAKEDENFRKVIEFLLKSADLGIVDISVEEKTEEFPIVSTPDKPMFYRYFDIQMKHNNNDPTNPGISFSIEDESLGTRRLFEISGPWIIALTKGCTLIVDELDASLHPHLVRFLVGLIHNEVNHQNPQLIFNTHDTTLLDSTLFRRDQIWFVEKDNTGASHLYPLLDFSPRKDESLAKGYLQGRYGAIPFIGELSPGLTADAKK